MTSEKQRLLVGIGSYASTSDNGVLLGELNQGTGELTILDGESGLLNPTFVAINKESNILYAIEEVVVENGKAGGAVALRIDAGQGKLELINRVNTVPGTTCHIQLNEAEDRFVVVSYHGGQVGLLAIQPDGQVGELLDMAQHTGSSVVPERQAKPHPHSAFFTPDQQFLLVSDLGTDNIITYRLVDNRTKLEKVSETFVYPGAGPRHLVFHPNGQYVYGINEIDSTVSAYAFDQESGELQMIGAISTVPEEFEGNNDCAEIAISADGRFLYGSNRGHDSIVIYEIKEDGADLDVIAYESTRGGHPRHFAIVPNGDYLLVANRDGNNIVSFKRDASSGLLSYTGHVAEVSKPVCVRPFYA